MSNKLTAALTLTAAIAVSVPIVSRAVNFTPSMRADLPTPKSTRVEEVRGVSTEDGPKVLTFEVTPSGFEPTETIVPRGRFLILLQNRTGRRDLNFWLVRENEARLAESEPQKRDWKALVHLTPGTYVIGETNHPEWKSIIRVTN